MAKQKHFSRELREEELPEEANENLEKARPTHRKAPQLPGRAGGSEEKPGVDKRQYTGPANVKTPIKFPPVRPPK